MLPPQLTSIQLGPEAFTTSTNTPSRVDLARVHCLLVLEYRYTDEHTVLDAQQLVSRQAPPSRQTDGRIQVER